MLAPMPTSTSAPTTMLTMPMTLKTSTPVRYDGAPPQTQTLTPPPTLAPTPTPVNASYADHDDVDYDDADAVVGADAYNNDTNADVVTLYLRVTERKLSCQPFTECYESVVSCQLSNQSKSNSCMAKKVDSSYSIQVFFPNICEFASTEP